MNFGQNLYDWLVGNIQSLVLVGILVMGGYLIFKREFTRLIGFGVIAVIAIGLVYNTMGVKDFMLSLFNRVISGA